MQSILEDWHPNKRIAVYIHIPFCSKICSYCRLSRGLLDDELSDIYSRNITQHIERFSDLLNSIGKKLSALFIGGGTPTSLLPSHLNRILDAICRFRYLPNAEITIESSFRDYLRARDVLLGSKVNRISFGLQVADDERCDVLGRTLPINDCRRILDCAGSDGLTLSVDLMYGLQNVTRTNLAESCFWVSQTPITGIELNRFVLQEGTLIYRDRKKYDRASFSNLARYDEFTEGVIILLDKGFKWKSPCQLSRAAENRFLYERIWHNGGDCLAFGPGVKGRLGKLLYFTTPKIEEFISDKHDNNFSLISEARFFDSIAYENQDLFFELMKGNFKEDFFEHSFLQELLGTGLVSKELHGNCILTMKGRYYIANIAQALFGDCIETRKQKNDWFEQQRNSSNE